MRNNKIAALYRQPRKTFPGLGSIISKNFFCIIGRVKRQHRQLQDIVDLVLLLPYYHFIKPFFLPAFEYNDTVGFFIHHLFSLMQ